MDVGRNLSMFGDNFDADSARKELSSVIEVIDRFLPTALDEGCMKMIYSMHKNPSTWRLRATDDITHFDVFGGSICSSLSYMEYNGNLFNISTKVSSAPKARRFPYKTITYTPFGTFDSYDLVEAYTLIIKNNGYIEYLYR